MLAAIVRTKLKILTGENPETEDEEEEENKEIGIIPQKPNVFCQLRF